MPETEVSSFLPIWSCSVWGLPCPLHYCRGGALLPHLFTLTSPCDEAVCFLWHFPSNRLKPAVPDVIRHTALRSSDFPLPHDSGRPIRLPTGSLYATGEIRERDDESFLELLKLDRPLAPELCSLRVRPPKTKPRGRTVCESSCRESWVHMPRKLRHGHPPIAL